jgi:hypothetical protein
MGNGFIPSMQSGGLWFITTEFELLSRATTARRVFINLHAVMLADCDWPFNLLNMALFAFWQ